MHPSFHELSEIAAGRRDGDGDAHVRSCPDCRDSLESLRRIRAGLAALPAFAPPQLAWPAIRARAAASGVAPHRTMLAAAASVLVAVAAAWLLAGRPAPVTAPVLATGGAPVNALVAENARLEALLSQLPESRTTRLGTAYTVAAIEDRLALVDDRLTTVTFEPYAPEVAEDLWRERVTLMNSLVQVQYARALATR